VNKLETTWKRSRYNFKATPWNFSQGVEETPEKPRIITAGIRAVIWSRKCYHSTDTFRINAEDKYGKGKAVPVLHYLGTMPWTHGGVEVYSSTIIDLGTR
jgi:hypothetical protein